MPRLNKTRNPSPAAGYKKMPLNSYYRAKADDTVSSPFKKRQPKKNYRKLFLNTIDSVLIVLIVAGLAYSLLLKSSPKITVSDNSYRSTAEYRARILPLFNSIKNRNKISFDETEIVSKIQKIFPEVQAAGIELPFISQVPVVSLTVSPPAFKLLSGSSAYIVDFQGVAVARASQLPHLSPQATLTDQSGYQAADGSRILSSQSVDFINIVLVQARAAKVPVSSLTLPRLAQEMDLRTADQPYYVKFYLGGDAMTQTGQFLAGRKKLIESSQTPGQYLDVRVSGKIFYK